MAAEVCSRGDLRVTQSHHSLVWHWEFKTAKDSRPCDRNGVLSPFQAARGSLTWNSATNYTERLGRLLPLAALKGPQLLDSPLAGLSGAGSNVRMLRRPLSTSVSCTAPLSLPGGCRAIEGLSKPQGAEACRAAPCNWWRYSTLASLVLPEKVREPHSCHRGGNLLQS